MIAFDSVSVRYAGASRRALEGVTFRALRGHVTAVVGPNGSGKSTLVRVLLGRVSLESGIVHLDEHGLDVLTRREVATRIAVVLQREEPVFPLRVDEYVALGRYARVRSWRPGAPRDDAVVTAALERTDAAALRGRRIDQLSGGEWQRVRLARALAQESDGLVLDEPGTFLDIAHEMEQFEMLTSLAQGNRAVMLVSHQLNLVARFADTLVLLDEGRVAAHGPPSEVMRGDVLERVYRWPVLVARDPVVGAPTLVPLRRPGQSSTYSSSKP
jgi:iron complex transport system ATP-binding protein